MKEENNIMEVNRKITDTFAKLIRGDILVQEALKNIQDIIRLAEESLVGRIRGKIQKAIDKLPSELSMMQGGSYVTLDSILDWEELQTPKSKGSE